MHDPSTTLTIATSALAGLAVIVSGALIGWRGWLQLKHEELLRRDGSAIPAATEPTLPNAGARIEIADLKERIRKLEAIAAGVEL